MRDENEREEFRSPAALAGFESAEGTSVARTEVGSVAAAAREEAELKSAIFLARQFPRDEARSYTKIVNSAKRPTFAEDAMYAFPRSGQTVTGPSVQMAREIARCWGNMRYGLRIVSADADTVHIRGYAYDLETNAYVEHEDKFAKLVQRKRGGKTEWVPPDERDLRELVNRRGAILVRNAILQVVPSDVVEDAMRTVQETLKAAAKGEIKQNRQDAIRRLAVAFDGIGISTEMLEKRLGHPLDAITPDELTELRGVFKSITDGNTKREEYFDLNRGRGLQTESNVTLNERLSGLGDGESAATADDAGDEGAPTGQQTIG